ncbi:hypothetical protein A3E45_01220 [Candidatus Daviesbacteria bacterium RIFCSPHIGHO2_12_FULL_43_11]|uniref:DUF2304 domain-containing protein n=2 Tax=Candidatus Daviesiibacteriota TaxID=1752718 RepID=A0A1F5K6C8_9BACT|nr:MAG: hypothetical protein UV33_C0048G0004 [Candidatus Daviesbacteria bacterium GW2011_GWA1_42_6]OGE36523.1 MAG: hypothetical protein A3E45_01220 [Candidatus Daviesbacteria bacterium RIFCSPHIGHO2_12_FULL_43_11]
MSISQLLLSTIIIFIIYKTAVSFRHGNLSRNFTSIWLLLWISVLFFIFEQNTLIRAAHFLGISRGVDLVIYLAVILTFYLIYKIFFTLNQINQKVTEIIREMAVKNPKKVDTKHKKA